MTNNLNRCNPKLKAADLTIKEGDRDFELRCIIPEDSNVETRIVPPEGYDIMGDVCC